MFFYLKANAISFNSNTSTFEFCSVWIKSKFTESVLLSELYFSLHVAFPFLEKTPTWYTAIFFTFCLEPGVFCTTAAMRKHIGTVCRADRERRNISQSHYILWHLQHHPEQSNKDILFTFYLVLFPPLPPTSTKAKLGILYCSND